MKQNDPIPKCNSKHPRKQSMELREVLTKDAQKSEKIIHYKKYFFMKHCTCREHRLTCAQTYTDAYVLSLLTFR